MKVKSRKRSRRPNTRYSSRLTSKFQATIPKEVRKQLKLESGDQIVYEVLQDGTVIVRKSSPIDWEYLHALNETSAIPAGALGSGVLNVSGPLIGGFNVKRDGILNDSSVEFTENSARASDSTNSDLDD